MPNFCYKSQGVEELNNDIAHQEVDDVEHSEEKEDNESTEDKLQVLWKHVMKQKMRRDTTYGETGDDHTSISMTPRCSTLARAMMTSRPRL